MEFGAPHHVEWWKWRSDDWTQQIIASGPHYLQFPSTSPINQAKSEAQVACDEKDKHCSHGLDTRLDNNVVHPLDERFGKQCICQAVCRELHVSCKSLSFRHHPPAGICIGFQQITSSSQNSICLVSQHQNQETVTGDNKKKLLLSPLRSTPCNDVMKKTMSLLCWNCYVTMPILVAGSSFTIPYMVVRQVSVTIVMLYHLS